MNWSPTIKLCLPDAENFNAVYPVPTEEQPGPDPHEVAIVRLGTLYEPGEYDSEGNEITPPVALPGYHVDLRLRGVELPEALAPYVVTPESPVHEFQGA